MFVDYRILTTAAVVSAGCLLASLTNAAVAAPLVTGVSGTLSHKSTVTITGSGFGTKSTAAPVVWDDASGASLSEKWNLSVPYSASDSSYNIQYRAAGYRGVAGPHTNASKYIVGGHPNSWGPYNGGNVMMLVNRKNYSNGDIYYVSWYERVDPNWTYANNDLDANFKWFAYNGDTGPYNLPYNWYLAYNPGTFQISKPTPQELINDDAQPTSNKTFPWPNDSNGNDWYWGSGPNPRNGWIKKEVQTKITNDTSGYIKAWENGVLTVNYGGPTDKYPNPGGLRSFGVGGYCGCYNIANGTHWRYFADVYLDYSPARVVLANNPDLSQATTIEVQIPKTWSSTSVSASVNLGKFTAGQTAYLFVFDPTGARNATGFPITVGSSGGGVTLPAPTNLRVQ
jgi:hypothetical protein